MHVRNEDKKQETATDSLERSINRVKLYGHHQEKEGPAGDEREIRKIMTGHEGRAVQYYPRAEEKHKELSPEKMEELG